MIFLTSLNRIEKSLTCEKVFLSGFESRHFICFQNVKNNPRTIKPRLILPLNPTCDAHQGNLFYMESLSWWKMQRRSNLIGEIWMHSKHEMAIMEDSRGQILLLPPFRDSATCSLNFIARNLTFCLRYRRFKLFYSSKVLKHSLLSCSAF